MFSPWEQETSCAVLSENVSGPRSIPPLIPGVPCLLSKTTQLGSYNFSQTKFKDSLRTNHGFQGLKFNLCNKSAFFDPLLNALYGLNTWWSHLQLFFIHSAMNDHIIIYYVYITFTFRNNCLQSGNSHWVWFSVLLHLRYRKSIWNKETEIKYCSCTKICLWYPCVLQVLRPSLSQVNKVVNLRTFQDLEKKSAKQNKHNFC